jgi:hypothetical protein
MGLINQTAYQYYTTSEKFTGDGTEDEFTLSFDPAPSSASDFLVYVNGNEIDDDLYSYSIGVITFDTAPLVGSTIVVTLKNQRLGDYRYTSLSDVVRNFMVSYVGDGKIISKARRSDVVFHAKRAIQEFSYDISRVEKIQEIELGPTLTIPMPQDYVNYVALSWVDQSGIEHPIPNGRITSKPSQAILQDDEFNYLFDNDDSLLTSTSVTNERFVNLDANRVSGSFNNDDYFMNANYPIDTLVESGKRYGGDPEVMNSNGMFMIDEANGTFAFSSNLSGAVITIKYISDGLGTDEEMKVHKLSEEAIYKYVAHALLDGMANIPEYVVSRFKRERRAAMRNAKLRLYNLKQNEVLQVMRGKSKQIKH